MKFLAMALTVFFTSASFAAVDLQCPARIQTTQTLFEAEPRWQESPERPSASVDENKVGYSNNALSYVDFFVGVPEQMVSLHPDFQSPEKAGHAVSRWKFSAKDEIWFACSYRFTSVKLIKKLPPHTTTCSVKYKRNGVERVWCS